MKLNKNIAFIFISIFVSLVISCSGASYQSGATTANSNAQLNPNGNLQKGENLKLQSYTEERIFQKHKPLDILIVMDNTSSMAQEQQHVIDGLPNLLQYIKDEDWQIGVISTTASSLGWIKYNPNSDNVAYNYSVWTEDNFNYFNNKIKNQTLTDPKCIHELIKSTDNNIAETFSLAINVGLGGSNPEAGILQAVNGLKNAGCGKWLRDNSVVAVLIVTDEDNNGDEQNNGCRGDSPKSECAASHLISYLKNIRPNNDARVFGIIPVDGRKNKPNPEAYVDLLKATGTDIYRGNVAGNADSFKSTLQAMSKTVASDIAGEYELDHHIDKIMNIVITTTNKDGQEVETELNSGFSIEGNKLRFESGVLPTRIEKLKFRYTSSL